MKNNGPARKLRFGTLWDRVFAALAFAVFAGLVYLAAIGRFDAQLNQFADWLKDLFG